MALFEGLKLPDILKASAAQALALAAACAAILYLSTKGLIPPLEPWMIIAAAFVGIFAVALCITLLLRGAVKFVDIPTRWSRWHFRKARRKAVADYIPHMAEDERTVIGYLLEHNQKSFDCDVDGGNARTLLARGIIVNAVRPGQVFEMDRAPMNVPDDVWDVLVKHRHAFPGKYKGDAHPWRVHWMAR